MPTSSEQHPPHQYCAVCSGLADDEHAQQKWGWEQEDTQLPVASGSLVQVLDLQPYGSRKLELLQCPACGTYYLYRTDYTYLSNGSEDEQYLTRLSGAEAAAYLAGAARPLPRR